MTNANTAQPTFTAPSVLAIKDLKFKLTVSDGQLMDMDTVIITVTSQDWVVTTLSNSATLIAKVKINSLDAVTGDLVGAFAGGTARGVVEVFLFEGQPFISMLIQVENTETITFKVYDVSDDQLCEVGVTLSVTPGQAIGTPTDPYLINSTCTNNCPQNILNLNDDPISEDIYQAANEITSGGKVNPMTEVNFEAGISITLFDGFHAKSNSTFTATITDCQVPAFTYPAIERKLSVMKNTLSLKVQPNPFKNFTIIRVNIPGKEEKLLLQVFNANGTLMKTISSAIYTKGWHEFEFKNEGLKSGFYYIIGQTKSGIASKKIIQINN